AGFAAGHCGLSCWRRGFKAARNEKPRTLRCGVRDSGVVFPGYAPDRPAPVGEVIRTSTRTDAAAAVGVVVRSVRRCNMQREKHAARGRVNSRAYADFA